MYIPIRTHVPTHTQTRRHFAHSVTHVHYYIYHSLIQYMPPYVRPTAAVMCDTRQPMCVWVVSGHCTPLHTYVQYVRTHRLQCRESLWGSTHQRAKVVHQQAPGRTSTCTHTYVCMYVCTYDVHVYTYVCTLFQLTTVVLYSSFEIQRCTCVSCLSP